MVRCSIGDDTDVDTDGAATRLCTRCQLHPRAPQQIVHDDQLRQAQYRTREHHRVYVDNMN